MIAFTRVAHINGNEKFCGVMLIQKYFGNTEVVSSAAAKHGHGRDLALLIKVHTDRFRVQVKLILIKPPRASMSPRRYS